MQIYAGSPRVPDRTYVFVDGAYLRKVVDEFIAKLFAVPAEMDFSALRGVAPDVRRVFYYDSIHDVLKDGESTADLETRIKEQEVFFDRIQALEGFHVRLGSVKGNRKKLRQKKVDVLLAVEALELAFRGTMTRACFIAGDLDFAPLVDSLIRIGTYVQILYSPTSAAKDLYMAADMGQPITFGQVYGWMTPDFRKRNPTPSGAANSNLPTDIPLQLMKSGKTGDAEIALYSTGADYILFSPKLGPYSLMLRFPNADFLVRYFEVTHGPVVWHRVLR